MRIRILKPIAGIIQGVSLGSLRVGLTYDIDATLARYLVSTGAAEAVASTLTRVVRHDDREGFTKTTGGTDVVEAADKPERKRSARRKKR